MAASSHITSACPRLSKDPAVARVLTTAEVLAVLGDRPDRKRNGTLRAIVVRHIPRLDGADLGLSLAIV